MSTTPRGIDVDRVQEAIPKQSWDPLGFETGDHIGTLDCRPGTERADTFWPRHTPSGGRILNSPEIHAQG